MNRARIAKAYEKIAEGYAELALAFEEDTPSSEAADTGAGGASAYSPARSSAPVADLQPLQEAPKRLPPRQQQNDSAFTKCPAHDKPWTEGKFGPYCTSSSEDPEWSNDRGYCRVTPRSAAAWLRQHPKVTA